MTCPAATTSSTSKSPSPSSPANARRSSAANPAERLPNLRSNGRKEALIPFALSEPSYRIAVRAKFHIDQIYSVEGRGTVLQGTIVEGQLTRGMSLQVLGVNRSLVIAEIGAIHGQKIPLGSLGLVLRGDATGTPEELRPLIEGKTVALT